MSERAVYTAARWPDAAILRVMPTGRGFDWVKSLVGDVSGHWRIGGGDQGVDEYWKLLQGDHGVCFVYARCNEEGQPLMPPLVIFSMVRFQEKAWEGKGTPFVVDRIAWHSDVFGPFGADRTEQDRRLEHLLGRLRWFLFDALELDIAHDIDHNMMRELRIPMVFSVSDLQHWKKDERLKAIELAVEHYRTLWRQTDLIRRAFEGGHDSAAWMAARQELGSEPTAIDLHMRPILTINARSKVFELTWRWVKHWLEGDRDRGRTSRDDEDAWCWWNLKKVWTKGLVLALDMPPDGTVQFTIGEINTAPDLGHDDKSPLTALLRAGVFLTEPDIDAWMKRSLEPGEEVVDTSIYLALSTGSPFLWENDRFAAWAQQLGLR